jgi:ribosomal protein S18 acetylase RimI-like enzyme
MPGGGGHADRITTRPARRDDARAIAKLSRELRQAIGEPADLFSEAVILRDGFGDKPEFEVIIAERGDGEVVGYALHYDAYEPGYAARGVYLADLVVAKSARRSGVGRVLVAAVEAATRARGRSYVWWIVPPGNKGALRFYEALRPPIRQNAVLHVLLVGEV